MESKRVYLYRITNQVNGKVYIGSTVNPASRFAVYRSRCHNSHLRCAFEKYGLSAFAFEVMACVVGDRDSAEEAAIVAYSATDPARGYNQIAGGRGSQWSEARKAAAKGRVSPNKGKRGSAEASARKSAALKGMPKSEEHRRKMSENMKRIRAEKHWRSLSGKNTRRGPFKPESIEKMRQAALERWAKRKVEAT